MNSRKFYPLYFPVVKRCYACQTTTFVSAVTVVSSQRDRQRYFCVNCATQQGNPPSEHLVQRIQKMRRQCENSSHSRPSETRLSVNSLHGSSTVV
ncbi:MAG TPA: hypothetical protein V6D19_11055 [Stenomitos sp.]